jgi:hypothetical protein
MNIVTSALQLSASHAEASRHDVSESLRMWTGKRPDFGAMEQAQRNARTPVPEMVRISAAATEKQAAETNAVTQAANAADNDPQLMLIRAVVEALTGVTIDMFDASKLTQNPPPAAALPDPNKAAANASSATAPEANFGVEYDRHESFSESESTRFQADGVVRTADGKEMRFSVDLQMSRSYHVESDVSLRLGNAKKKDPLAINFGGSAAQLSDQKFRIDLNADGKPEEARFLASGSGFLVFDRNGDGKINDGREMFGALSGNGFAELAALDRNGNGWIDAADAGFAGLRVWTKAADGSDHLATLAASGVGALGLASVATPFDIKDSSNASLGAIRSSGVYLKESGGAGTIQQIDLTV